MNRSVGRTSGTEQTFGCHAAKPPDQPATWCAICGAFSKFGEPWIIPKYAHKWMLHQDHQNKSGPTGKLPSGFKDDRCAVCGHDSVAHHAGSGHCYHCEAHHRCIAFVERDRLGAAPGKETK